MNSMSLFDALRIAEATAEGLAIDAEELTILKTKGTEALRVIANVKSVFGLDARVRK